MIKNNVTDKNVTFVSRNIIKNDAAGGCFRQANFYYRLLEQLFIGASEAWAYRAGGGGGR